MRPPRLLVIAGLFVASLHAASARLALVRTDPGAPCGLDAPQLESAMDWAFERGTTALVVARGGCIAAEGYATGLDPTQPEEIYSITKAVTAVLVGIALQEGVIDSLDQPLWRYFPEWEASPRDRVALRHLLTMTSGIVDPGSALRPGMDPVWYTRMMPLEAEPGARWRYNNWAFRLLFPVLSTAFGERLEEASRKRLFEPLGMYGTSWSAWPQTAGDPPLYIRSTARDVALLGRLLLAGGAWEGRALISPEFFQQAVAPSQALNPAYGLLFWLNREESGYTLVNGAQTSPGRLLPAAPPDLIAAFGARRHKLFVAPSQDLVIVRFGEAVDGLPEAGGPDSFDNQLYSRIAASLP